MFTVLLLFCVLRGVKRSTCMENKSHSSTYHTQSGKQMSFETSGNVRGGCGRALPMHPQLGKSIYFHVCPFCYKSSPHFSYARKCDVLWYKMSVNLQANQTTETSRCVLLLDALHFFPSFRRKQLPCPEDLVLILVPSLQRPFLVAAGPSLPGESRLANGDAMQKLAKSCVANFCLNMVLTNIPSSSASWRGKGCCLVREERCSQKDPDMTTVMLDTYFLGTVLGRAFCYFWMKKVGHFKPKTSHKPPPLPVGNLI